jgi:hypothetical protein
MKPNFRNLFRKKLTPNGVVPIISTRGLLTHLGMNEQARHPMVWVAVFTLEQKRPLAIANIKECS